MFLKQSILILVRPTEIPENDIFLCESVYDESKKQIRRNTPGNGVRKFLHSQLVTPDEIYHFKTKITPIKVNIPYYFTVRSLKSTLEYIHETIKNPKTGDRQRNSCPPRYNNR